MVLSILLEKETRLVWIPFPNGLLLFFGGHPKKAVATPRLEATAFNRSNYLLLGTIIFIIRT
jgi:hypothetical protein